MLAALTPETFSFAHELFTLGLGLIVALGGVVVTILSWIGRGALKRLDTTVERVDDHSIQLAVVAKSGLPKQVDDHEARIKALETVLGDLRGDIREIKTMLREQAGRERRPEQ